MNSKIKIILSFLIINIVSAPDQSSETLQDVAAKDVGGTAAVAEERTAQLCDHLDLLSALGCVSSCNCDAARRDYYIHVSCAEDKGQSSLIPQDPIQFVKTEASSPMPTKLKILKLSHNVAFNIRSTGLSLYMVEKDHKNNRFVVEIVMHARHITMSPSVACDILKPFFKKLIELRLAGNDCLDPVRESDIPEITDYIEKALDFAEGDHLIIKCFQRMFVDQAIANGHNILEILFGSEGEQDRNWLTRMYNAAKGMLLVNDMPKVTYAGEGKPYLMNLIPGMCLQVFDLDGAYIGERELGGEELWRIFESNKFIEKKPEDIKLVGWFKDPEGEYAFRFEFKNVERFLQSHTLLERTNALGWVKHYSALDSHQEGAREIGELYPASKFPVVI